MSQDTPTAHAIGTLTAFALMAGVSTVRAQDIEPRAYSNAPIGVNFLIAGYAYAQGGLAFDAALPVKDPDLKTSSAVLAYARVLDLWGTDVADLAGLPLGPWRLGLTLAGTRVEDLAPLAKAKSGLSVSLHGGPYRSLEPLHEVTDLSMSLAYDAKLARTLKRFT